MVDALEAYLFPGTVAENICFGPRQRAEELLVEVIERLLEGVGLAGYVRRGVSNLSGGKAQRVSLVRTLANPSEVLSLDEPTSALDEATQRGVEDLIFRITYQHGLTFLMVTHDIQGAARIATQVVVPERGQLIEFGPAEEVLNAWPILARSTQPGNGPGRHNDRVGGGDCSACSPRRHSLGTGNNRRPDPGLCTGRTGRSGRLGAALVSASACLDNHPRIASRDSRCGNYCGSPVQGRDIPDAFWAPNLTRQ